MFLIGESNKKHVKAVGILFAIQGIIWFICAVIAIIIKHSPLEKFKNSGTIEKYSDYLGQIIYDDFMIENNFRGKVIRPNDFEVFLWIYAILGIVWIAAVIDLYIAIYNNKLRQSLGAISLGIIVLITSIIDLVFFALLVRDFATCPFDLGIPEKTSASNALEEEILSTTDYTIITNSSTTTNDNLVEFSSLLRSDPNNSYNSLDCKLSNGIIMSLAARGYVLWIINVVLAINLIIIGSKGLKKPTLLTYGQNTIPRVQNFDFHQKSSSTPVDNDLIFYDDENSYMSPSSGTVLRNSNNTPISLQRKDQNYY